MAENSIRVIDIDGHVREADDLWERYLEPPFRSRAPKIQRVPNGQLLFLLEGNRHHRKPDESPFQVKPDDSPVNEHRDLATNPRERLKDIGCTIIAARIENGSWGLARFRFRMFKRQSMKRAGSFSSWASKQSLCGRTR